MTRRLFTRFLPIYLITVAATLMNQVLAQNEEEALSPTPKGSFSIVVMSDTQGYLGRGTKRQPASHDEVTNPIFDSQTQWITENIESQRIVFVTHAGDIVDINSQDQWEKARKFMDRLHEKIPYGISVGNHDMDEEGNSSLFQKYFPPSRFENFGWYGDFFAGDKNFPGISDNNANNFQLFSAEGIDFIILHLECNAPDSVLQWADNIMNQYEHRFAIVTTHMFLGPLEKPITKEGYYTDPKGVMLWTKCHGKRGNSAQQMWDKCFSKHRNLHLIFSGDQSRSNTMHFKNVGDNGNLVHAFLSDYSTVGGAVRIYRFLPHQDEIQVITYDTRNGKVVYQTPIVQEIKEHHFNIDMKFRDEQNWHETGQKIIQISDKRKSKK